MSSLFKGFTQGTSDFLAQLSVNNNKPWFEDHRKEYEMLVLQPMKELVTELGELMLAIDPQFEVRPAVNKTISGIYRDIRFSHDKSPYKTNVWITFKRPGQEWKDKPAFFFELALDSYRYGMGFYCATPRTMEDFRAKVDANPADFEQAIAFYCHQRVFELEGEKYKKAFTRGYAEGIMDWYQRKNFYLVCQRETDKILFSPKFSEELKTGFKSLAPLYQFLLNV